MKLIGVLIVLISAWGFGSSLIQKMNQQEKQLFAFREMIDLFSAEIQYGRTPLKEACLQISLRMQEPYCSILNTIAQELDKQQFYSFECIWREAFAKAQKEFLLSEEGLELLYGLGKYLGILDKEAQLRHMQQYAIQVDHLLQQLQKGASEKKKVYRSVSLMVGAMVILLFI